MNLKALKEKREDLLNEMQDTIENVEKENRALTEDEDKKFDDAKKEIERIDSTIKKTEELRAMSITKPIDPEPQEPKEDKEKTEIRAFLEYVINPQNRANIDVGGNGAIIPVTISNRIIEKIEDICPIYSLAEIFNVSGELRIPYYGLNGTEEITCAYAQEFTDLTSTAGKFTAVTLTGYTAGALTKISKSLIGKANEWGFDLTGYIVRKLGEAIAQFLEHELLLGTGTNACQGILTGATNIVNSSATATIGSDDLINLQEAIIDRYQGNAVWIMNRNTRAAIRKLKDQEGDYLLNRDFTTQWNYTLLGKPVYTSDNMPVISTTVNALPIIYGDMTGLSVKLSQGIELQVLQEHFALQHAVGSVGWIEVDSKVTDQQKLAVLQVNKTNV